MVLSRVANSGTFQTSQPSACEIRMTRLFNAPRALVFEVMHEPEHVMRWWGILDERYSVTVCEIDFRPGGAWRYVGKGPRGEYGFHGVYREINAPSRVVFTEIFDPFPDAGALVTCELSEEHGKTRMTLNATYPSNAVRDMVLGSGMERGAGISYDMLEGVLTDLQANRGAT